LWEASIMKNKGTKIAIASIALISVIVFSLWVTGIIGLWRDGMSYFVGKPDDFSQKLGHLLPGTYSVSINLEDLESNIGKDLYNDGEYRIYVGWIDNTGNFNTGGYRIEFRSSGKYSLNGATLISGLRYETISQNVSTSHLTSGMTAKYNEKIYNSSRMSSRGVGYKDGDGFSFYIFPTEAYENGEISLDGKGTVELTITNLYKNIWIRK